MPEFVIELEIWCGTCGNGLCFNTTQETRGRKKGLHVTVCEMCLKEAIDTAQEKKEISAEQ